MNPAYPLTHLLPSLESSVLGWTLVHSLWQGSAVWLLLQIALGLMKKRTPQARYLMACMALAVMAMASWMTYGALDFAARMADREQEQSANSGAAGRNISVTAQAAAVADTAGAKRKAAAVQAQAVDGNSPSFVVVQTSPVRNSSVIPYISRRSLGSDNAVLSWLPVDGDWLVSVVQHWLPALVAMWWLGIMISGVRLFVGWRTACRLSHAPLLALPAQWQRRWQLLVQRAGIGFAVRMGETAAVTVPLVVGWLKPAVLLPAGALAGMPVEQVEAILLHELAHIRRHDFAVNLLQSVVETLFFYHPAVWSISSRIRHERELVCDDLAVHWSGNRLEYAEALAAFEGMRSARLAPGMAITGGNTHGKGDGDLLFRVRRIVLGVEPAHRLGTGPMFSAGSVLIVAIYLFTMFLAPALASDLVQSQERAKAVEEAQKIFAPSESKAKELREAEMRTLNGEPDPKDKDRMVRVFGTFKTEDGKPLPEGDDFPLLNFQIRTTGGGHYVGTVPREKGSLSWTHPDVPFGKLSLVAWPRGYAPVILDNLPVTGDTCGPLELLFTRGISAKIRVLSPKGKPVQGVSLDCHLKCGPGFSAPEIKTDAQGIACLGQVNVKDTFIVRATKQGWQDAGKIFDTWSADKIPVWTLQPALATEGTVLDAETRKPVANATLHLALCEEIRTDNDYSRISPVSRAEGPYNLDASNALGTTDANGHFKISSLNTGNSYHLYAKAPGYATTAFPVHIGKSDNKMELPRGFRLQGRILDPHGLLPKGETSFKLFSQVTHNPRANYFSMATNPTDVEKVGDEISFSLKDMWSCYVKLWLVKKDGDPLPVKLCSASVNLNRTIDDFVMTLEKVTEIDSNVVFERTDMFINQIAKPEITAPVRFLKVRLDAGKDQVTPTGRLKASFLPDGRDSTTGTQMKVTVPVIDGVATVPVPMPNTVTLFGDLNGFWFKRMTLEVEAGKEPVEMILPVIPAGAIKGKLVKSGNIAQKDGTGSQAPFYDVEALVIEPAPGTDMKPGPLSMQNLTDQNQEVWDTRRYSASNYIPARQGEDTYLVSPLPLGGTYAIVIKNVSREGNDSTYVSSPVKLDASQPVVDMTMGAGVGKDLQGRFVDEAGKPLGNRMINVEYNLGKDVNYTFFYSTTAADGTFTIPNLNLDAPVTYTIGTPQTEDGNIITILNPILDTKSPQPVTIRCKLEKKL